MTDEEDSNPIVPQTLQNLKEHRGFMRGQRSCRLIQYKMRLFNESALAISTSCR